MRNGDRITQSIGQSSARWQVLGRIGYESQTVAHIARSIGYARQSVQRVADVLVKDGLAAYKTNPHDRRTQLLYLTPRGADTLAAIYAKYGEWQQHMVSKLDTTQLAAIATKLDEIAEILELDEQNNKEKT